MSINLYRKEEFIAQEIPVSSYYQKAAHIHHDALRVV
jgi:hypothetical protein